ncbi:twin-arginine translocase TatA/TatE family subunit, partial [Neobacillus drentensis]
ILILVLVLIVFGPKKLQELGRAVGQSFIEVTEQVF